jgi:hypothetical protein
MVEVKLESLHVQGPTSLALGNPAHKREDNPLAGLPSRPGAMHASAAIAQEGYHAILTSCTGRMQHMVQNSQGMHDGAALIETRGMLKYMDIPHPRLRDEAWGTCIQPLIQDCSDDLGLLLKQSWSGLGLTNSFLSQLGSWYVTFIVL